MIILTWYLDLDSLFGDPSGPVTPEDHSKPTNSTSTEALICHQDDPVYGLRWSDESNIFAPTPQWTVEPTISAIILTLEKAIDLHKQYNVEHLWDGTYNKIYAVSYDQKQLIMRVSLPVCPRTKTESEAATIQWIYENTNLPVPKVECYDSSRNNPIGFEWILMERIDGIPLSQCWASVTQGAKERIVRQVARYAATAFTTQFKGISDERHREIATRMLMLVDRLREIEDRFFPTPEIGSSQNLVHDDEESTDEGEDVNDKGGWPHEPTMLWHDDISLDNILVDKNGILCGVIGWECVSCLPLYEACQFPAFLKQAQDRPIEPLTPLGATRKQPSDSRDLTKYNRDLRQHHITLLRRLFVTEMMDKCPVWVDIFDSRRYLRDYEAAVQNCDNDYAYEMVERWVDAVEKGESSDKTPWHLHERLMG
ncbi:kinase-like protein [Annulohypoxylon bovei var. microspora]|nr:kinase-like protein [Annulohypoxylon bovei var. microspora]